MHTLKMQVALSAAKTSLLMLLQAARESDVDCSAVSVALWIDHGEADGEYQFGNLDKHGQVQPVTGGSL